MRDYPGDCWVCDTETNRLAYRNPIHRTFVNTSVSPMNIVRGTDPTVTRDVSKKEEASDAANG
jgi:hypothetical protein